MGEGRTWQARTRAGQDKKGNDETGNKWKPFHLNKINLYLRIRSLSLGFNLQTKKKKKNFWSQCSCLSDLLPLLFLSLTHSVGPQSSLLLSSTPALPVTAASWWSGSQSIMLSSTASASSKTAHTAKVASTPQTFSFSFKTWRQEPFIVLRETPGVPRTFPEMTSQFARSHVRG